MNIARFWQLLGSSQKRSSRASYARRSRSLLAVEALEGRAMLATLLPVPDAASAVGGQSLGKVGPGTMILAQSNSYSMVGRQVNVFDGQDTSSSRDGAGGHELGHVLGLSHVLTAANARTHDDVIGGWGNDWISGGTGQDGRIASGGAGLDILIGNTGGDRLIDRSGRDLLIGGDGETLEMHGGGMFRFAEQDDPFFFDEGVSGQSIRILIQAADAANGAATSWEGKPPAEATTNSNKLVSFRSSDPTTVADDVIVDGRIITAQSHVSDRDINDIFVFRSPANTNQTDDNNHGTHVAGTIGNNAVAPAGETPIGTRVLGGGKVQMQDISFVEPAAPSALAAEVENQRVIFPTFIGIDGESTDDKARSVNGAATTLADDGYDETETIAVGGYIRVKKLTS